MIKSNFYVYRHIRLDNNRPFYVGKGSGRRAFIKTDRNDYWNKIVNKVNYKIEIMLNNLMVQKNSTSTLVSTLKNLLKITLVNMPNKPKLLLF